ncbi:MAG: OmpA family protein [Owenweeksia sp.]
MKKFIALVGLVLVNTISFAQLKQADADFANFKYTDAVRAYEFALKHNPKKADHIVMRLAESYRLMGDYENAEKWYAKVMTRKNVDPVNYFYYGKMLESNSKHEAAKEWFDKFIEKQPKDTRALAYKAYSTEKVTELLTDKERYQVFRISVNSEYDDFSPMYYGQKVVFATNRPEGLLVSRKHSWNDLPYVDLYVADRQDDGDLIDANPLPEFNGNWHEGPVTFSKDLKRIYFTRNSSRGNTRLEGTNSTTNLMIYTARKVTLGDGVEIWTDPESLDFNSLEYSCEHPALSADGQKIYFASDQPGGQGGMDLYVTEKTILGWSKPKNLGPKINTSGDEAFPYISDSGELYFASNGHLGLGGLDLFLAASLSEGGFTEPINLGYPINDVMDDFGLVLNDKENEGYFTTNRNGGVGRDDIMRFKVLDKPEPPKEEPKIPQLEIFVYDQVTGEGLSEAVVNIFTRDGKLIDAVQTNDTGFYSTERDAYSGELRFITSYPEYASLRKVISMETLPLQLARINLPLSKDLGKITRINGKAIQINPIYFDYDKANIRSDAAVELDKIVRVMKENPTMVIEVASHTDSRGKNQYNSDLSQRRAKSSREYIISRGVAESRIFGQGYGESQLTNECEDGVECSEAKHQLNRRTEFRIVKF